MLYAPTMYPYVYSALEPSLDLLPYHRQLYTHMVCFRCIGLVPGALEVVAMGDNVQSSTVQQMHGN